MKYRVNYRRVAALLLVLFVVSSSVAVVSIVALLRVNNKVADVSGQGIAIAQAQAIPAECRTDRPSFDEREMRVTAYTADYESTGKHRGMAAYGVCADGHKIGNYELVVAAGKNIPFGTKVFVPMYGMATVHDRGDAIGDNDIDVFFWDLDVAQGWGVKDLKVKIYR